MKRSLLFVAAILAAVTSGCSKTGEGMAEDTERNMESAGEAVERTGERMQDASKETPGAAANASAATMLTPKIKSALIANPILNDSDNKIDVDSTASEVTLRGHVRTQSAKAEAEKIAREVLADSEASQRLVNLLEIR